MLLGYHLGLGIGPECIIHQQIEGVDPGSPENPAHPIDNRDVDISKGFRDLLIFFL